MTSKHVEKKSGIIIVNGPSSSGKSTLCNILLEEMKLDAVYFGVDSIFSMVPPAYAGAHNLNLPQSDGFSYIHEAVGGQRCVSISAGPWALSLIEEGLQFTKTLAQRGFLVLLDWIVFSAGDSLIFRNFLRDLADSEINTVLVNLSCDLETLEQREATRRHSVSGLARGTVEASAEFDSMADFKLDSTHGLTRADAEEVLDIFENRYGSKGK